MPQIINVLRAPYDFLFGENGVFDAHGESKEKRQAMYYGLPAIIMAVMGGLFLMVGELKAGKDLQESYLDRIEKARASQTEINKDVVREARMKSANATPGTPLNQLIPEDDPRRVNLKELIADEETYLKKLNSLAPDDPEHLFNLAKLYLRKGDSEQGMAMMKQLAPLTSPGFLKAHLNLAADAFQRSKASGNRERQRLLNLSNDHVDRALLRDENNINAIQLKFTLMMQLAKYDEARKYLDLFFAQEPRVYSKLCQLIDRIGGDTQDAKLAVLHSARSRFQEQLDRLQTPSVQRLQLLSLITDCLHRLKDFDQADALVNNELRIVSENPQLAEELGVKAWGQRILAIGKFLRYTQIGNPNTVTASNARTKIQLLQDGFELDPSNPNILRTLTQLQASQVPGVKEKVISIYDPRQQRDSIAEVDNILGVVALGEERFEDALEYFVRACKKAPKAPGYLNNRAYTRMQVASKAVEVAQEKVAKLIDGADEELLAQARSGLASAKRQQVAAAKAAVADADRAIQSIQTGTGAIRYLTNYYDTKGHALSMQGEYNLAAAEFLRAAVGRPNDASIAEAIRDCYQKDGQVDRAKVWDTKYQALLAQSKQASGDK